MSCSPCRERRQRHLLRSLPVSIKAPVLSDASLPDAKETAPSLLTGVTAVQLSAEVSVQTAAFRRRLLSDTKERETGLSNGGTAGRRPTGGQLVGRIALRLRLSAPVSRQPPFRPAKLAQRLWWRSVTVPCERYLHERPNGRVPPAWRAGEWRVLTSVHCAYFYRIHCGVRCRR